MGKDLEVINVGKGVYREDEIQTKFGPFVQLRPVALYYKEDGAVDDTPSFMFILHDPHCKSTVSVGGQISMNMLNGALAELGYQITKKQ